MAVVNIDTLVQFVATGRMDLNAALSLIPKKYWPMFKVQRIGDRIVPVTFGTEGVADAQSDRIDRAPLAPTPKAETAAAFGFPGIQI